MIRRIPDSSRDILAGSIYTRSEYIGALLTNAIDREASHVTIRVLPQLGFSVEDNGQGVDVEQPNHVVKLLSAVAVVTVESRDKKAFLQGHVNTITTTKSRDTLTTCSSLYYNIPVKRKYALQQRDYEQIIFRVWVEILRFPGCHVTIESASHVKIDMARTDSVLDRCLEMLEYYQCFARRVEMRRESCDAVSCDNTSRDTQPHDLSITGAIGLRSNGSKSVQLLLYNNNPIVLKKVEKSLHRYNYVLLIDSYAHESLSQQHVILELVQEWLEGVKRGKRSRSEEVESRPKKAVRMMSEGHVTEQSSLGASHVTGGLVRDVSDKAGNTPSQAHVATETASQGTQVTCTTTLTRFQNFKIISQLENRFILVMAELSSPTLICIDQHAADERILTDKVTCELITNASRDTSKTAEIVPLHLSLNMKLLLKYQLVLEKWGFLFENGYLTHVPFLSRDMDPFDLDLGLKEYLQMLENGGSESAVPPLLQQQVASWACRNAVKFGDHLTIEECHVMVEKLLKTKLPFQCAHGRPSMVPLALV